MPEALCPCPAGLRRDADRPACVNNSLSPCPGGVRTSEAAILPYVPYPTCLATGSLPATRLPVLQPRRTSQSGALMTDPITGIEVPVLAVTLHPQTRQWLTLGGHTAIRSPRPWPLWSWGAPWRILSQEASRQSWESGWMKTQVCWQPSCLPSALPPSGLASQAPPLSSPDPPHSGPVFSLHPKPTCISTLHALATFPLLPGFPHPHLQHSAPAPPRVGGRDEN